MRHFAPFKNYVSTLTALDNSLCALLALKLCILTCILIDMMYYIGWIIICIYSFIGDLLISYSVMLYLIIFLSVVEQTSIYTPYLI